MKITKSLWVFIRCEFKKWIEGQRTATYWLGKEMTQELTSKKTLLEEKHNYATFSKHFLGKNDKKNVKTRNSIWTTVIVCHLFVLSGLPERLQVITYSFTLLSLKRGISHETK